MARAAKIARLVRYQSVAYDRLLAGWPRDSPTRLGKCAMALRSPLEGETAVSHRLHFSMSTFSTRLRTGLEADEIRQGCVDIDISSPAEYPLAPGVLGCQSTAAPRLVPERALVARLPPLVSGRHTRASHQVSRARERMAVRGVRRARARVPCLGCVETLAGQSAWRCKHTMTTKRGTDIDVCSRLRRKPEICRPMKSHPAVAGW